MEEPASGRVPRLLEVGRQEAEPGGSHRRPPPSPAAGALALSLRSARRGRDGIRVRLPARPGHTRQLLRGQLRLPDLGRSRQLPRRHPGPCVPPIAGEQPEAAPCGSRAARARSRRRPRAQRPHSRWAPVPGDRLPPVRAAGGGDRDRVLVPAPAERRPQHGAAPSPPGRRWRRTGSGALISRSCRWVDS